jgi:hypothetical protein
MKLLFFIPVWKRPEITEICFMGIKRLQAQGVHEVIPFAVISEESMKPLCDKYNVQYCFYKNLPLGEKKNYGVSQLLKKDFDYMVELGSDDLLKNEFLDFYPWDKHVMGLNDFIIINSETGACRRLSSNISSFGTGLAIRKDVIEKCGDLWHPEKNRGMDRSVCYTLAKNGFMEHRFSRSEPLSIDIKSEVNLSQYSFTGTKYHIEKAFDGLSSQEIESIKALQYAGIEN